MRSVNGDLTMAAALGVLGVAMAVRSVSYDITAQGGGIGPGLMPFAAGVAMAVFSAWACAEIVVRQRRERRVATGGAVHDQRDAAISAATAAAEAEVVAPTTEAPAEPGESEGRPQRGLAQRKVILVFLLAVGATLLTSITGFLVAFGLLVLILLAVVEREPPWLAGTISVTAVAIAWLVFVQLLGVPLPGGALGLLGAG